MPSQKKSKSKPTNVSQSQLSDLIHLNKIFTVAKKEINLIKNQKIALALAFLYPFLVIYLLGMSTTGMKMVGELDLAVYIPRTGDFNHHQFIKALEGTERVRIIEMQSAEEVVEAVEKKKAPLGIVLKEPIEPHSTKHIDFYLDNSNLLTSKFFFGIARTIVMNVGTRESTKILSNLWGDLSDFSKEIEKEIKVVEEFEKELDITSKKLKTLNQKLNELNLSDLNQELEGQKANISVLRKNIKAYLNDAKEIQKQSEKTEKFNQAMENTKQDFNKLRETIETSRKELNESKKSLEEDEKDAIELREKLVEVRDQLKEYLEAVEELEGTLQGPDREALTEIKEDLEYLLEEVNKEIVEVDEVIERIRDKQERIDRLKKQLNIADQKLAEAEKELDSAKKELNNFSSLLKEKTGKAEEGLQDMNSALNQSFQALVVLQERLSSITKTGNRVKEFLGEALEARGYVEKRLSEAKSLLGDFSKRTAFLEKYSPEALSSPIKIHEKPLFLSHHLTILLPNILGIVLLFTCMLLTSISVIIEKTQGVQSRINLSTTHSFHLLTGKILGQSAFALFESLIILTVAFVKIKLPFSISLPGLGTVNSIGFGVPFAGSLSELFIALFAVSVTFISLGVLISSFTKNHSTAILSSLLIMVPMVFLSGIILPLELMSSAAQNLAELFPLTLANQILKAIIIKGVPLTELGSKFIYLLSLPFAIFVYLLIKR